MSRAEVKARFARETGLRRATAQPPPVIAPPLLHSQRLPPLSVSTSILANNPRRTPDCGGPTRPASTSSKRYFGTRGGLGGAGGALCGAGAVGPFAG